MKPTSPGTVYSIVAIATVESAVEGFTTYNVLVSYWGDPLQLTETPFVPLSDLQPLFDALRKCSPISQQLSHIDSLFLSSCSIGAVLLHMEDLELSCGCRRAESQDDRGRNLCPHNPCEIKAEPSPHPHPSLFMNLDFYRQASVPL
jgi:hypothetical protein